MAVYVDNAIYWAQMRIRGGWKSALVVSLGYAGVAGFLITLFYQLAIYSGDKRRVLGAASSLVLVAQVFLMLVLGGMSVAGSIRRDVTSLQIESHRLMPLSPVQAIAGYIAGATLQVLTLFVVNLLLGAVLILLLDNSIADWLAVNAILLLFSMSIWAAMSMAAFISRAMFGLFLGLCGVITFSGGMVLLLVPGLLAFCSPMQDRTIFQSTSFSRINEGTVVAAVAQVLLGILWIRSAARKYADGNAQSMTVVPALAMLGIWAGLSWFGITEYSHMRPSSFRAGQIDWRVPVVGAIASCLAVALLSLGALAWSNISREEKRGDGRKVRGRPWALWICVAICVLFSIVPLSGRMNEFDVYPARFTNPFGYKVAGPKPRDLPVLHYGTRPSVAMIACACAIFLVNAYLLMRLIYPRMRRANALVFFIIAGIWFAPLGADLIYYNMQTPEVTPHMDRIALLSPLGTIIQALDKPVDRTWRGLSGQGMFAAFLAVLYFISQAQLRRDLIHRRGSTAAPPQGPPAFQSIADSAEAKPVAS